MFKSRKYTPLIIHIRDTYPRPEARDVIATPNNATHSVCANATITKPKAASTQEILTRILKVQKRQHKKIMKQCWT